jgi:hypothetical protein
VSEARCTCVSCAECRGTGQVEYRTGLYPEWELESCSECYGTGIAEECAACEWDRERHEEEEP